MAHAKPPDPSAPGDPAAATLSDGRLARGERARTAVVEALMSLIQEGDLRPTAPRIAERAGVSRRLLFHHFNDLDDLFRELTRVQIGRIAPLIEPISPDLPLAQRIPRFVAQRARVLDYISPFRRAARLQEPTSPLIADGLSVMRTLMRAQVALIFGAELAALPADHSEVTRAALCTAASFSAWENLRIHQALPREQAERVMACLLRSLLRPSPSDRGETPSGDKDQ